MRNSSRVFFFWFYLAAGALLQAQVLGNDSLAGKYHFVQLEITASGDVVSEARTLAGSIDFDGAGSYTYAAEQIVGSADPQAEAGSGVYEVNARGSVELTNPLRETLSLNARLSTDEGVLLGSTTEVSGGTSDLFVAIKASEGLTNATLGGAYTGGSLSFSAANPSDFGSSLVSLVADGAGAFTSASVTGHRRGAPNETQSPTGATYSVASDGSGTASLGTAASLFSGDRKILLSGDGNYLLGYSAGDVRDIFIATRNHSGPAAGFDGRYWIAEITFDGAGFSSASGALSPDGTALVLVSERLHYESGTLDFSGLNFFAASPEGSGWFSNRELVDITNMQLGVTGNEGQASALVGAQVGVVGAPSDEFGVFFAVRSPTFAGSGLFLDPAGVVNGASFALLPNPVAPGSIVSLFGGGFAPLPGPAQATAQPPLPLPTDLLGLSVTVNGVKASLFFVSNEQVNVQIPFGLSGERATIRVTRFGAATNEVSVPLAPTSPGVFSFIQQQSIYAAIVTHANGTLVTTDRPATRGETVVIYVTGLGELDPPVAAGAANPGLGGESIARATDPQVLVLFNRALAQTFFAGGTPGFAGLYQINATIPVDVPAGTNVVLAVLTSNAFHDQVDIPILEATVASVKADDRAQPRKLDIRIPPRSRVQ